MTRALAKSSIGPLTDSPRPPIPNLTLRISTALEFRYPFSVLGHCCDANGYRRFSLKVADADRCHAAPGEWGSGNAA